MNWNLKQISRIDLRTVPLILALFVMSLLVMETSGGNILGQVRWLFIGTGVYLAMTCINYHKLGEWSWILYGVTIFLLIGLFFTDPVHNVRRWYRLPLLPFDIQPSEIAKLILVLNLSRVIEEKRSVITALFVIGVPFLLILKQPDLGSALVLYPITLVMFYIGGMNRKLIRLMSVGGLAGLSFVVMMFLGVLDHEKMRPYVTKVIKEYQYERLNPNTYHQKAAQTAIGLGAWTGSGWKRSEFTHKKWLPYAYTDSVFPAFAEEFGLIGAWGVIMVYFGLIYFSFQVTAVAKDHFGRVLSAGIATYFAIHVVVNMGMMCGLLPITGVPLLLVTYGGSSLISAMAALGVLQSIYTRRFMF